jgi:hypothetical protein
LEEGDFLLLETGLETLDRDLRITGQLTLDSARDIRLVSETNNFYT